MKALLGALLAAVVLAYAPGAWADITVVSSSSSAGSSAVSSVTLTKPAGTAANDLLLTFIAQRSGLALALPPSGWTLAVYELNAQQAMAVYRKVAGSAEPASYAWPLLIGARTAATVIAFRGVDTSAPIWDKNSQSNASSSTYTAPGIDMGSPLTMLVAAYSASNGNGSVNAANGMWAEIDVGTGAGPNGIVLGVSQMLQAAAGFSGAKVSTGNASLPSIGATLSLQPAASTASLHHLEVQHASGSGITCSPTSVTVRACQDASCSTLYTGGVSGSLSAGSGATVTWPSGSGFTIGSGASSTSVAMQMTTVGSALIGATASSPTAASATTCNFGSPACTFSAVDSGFVFNVPDHVSEVSQTVSISAVRKSDSSLACTPAFASKTKTLRFKCSHANPSSGFVPVRAGGKALNSGNSTGAACDATGQDVDLAFNASGVASFAMQYADVGQMTLNASYTGSGADAGLVMNGSDSFIAKPAGFAIGSASIQQTASPNLPNPAAADASGSKFVKAGESFSLAVTAQNSSGGTTRNFGRESPAEGVLLTAALIQPAGGVAGTLINASIAGASFTSGVATPTNLGYSEVGIIRLTPSLADGDYLGTGNVATSASSPNIGRFIPASFVVAPVAGTLVPKCSSSFTYYGQDGLSTGFTVTARNLNGGTTQNYEGSFAKLVPTAWSSFGFTAAPLPAGTVLSAGATAPTGTWTKGVATVTATHLISRAATPSSPADVIISATPLDSDGVTSTTTAVHAGTTPLRHGRLRMSNAFGSKSTALAMSVEAQYWSGKSWIKNNQDSCSSIPATAIARFNPLTPSDTASSAMNNTASAITIASGAGSLLLSAASPAAAGSLDLAINLGSDTTDKACTSATRPATVGANMPWLRSRYGSGGTCGTAWDSDPSARATFGIFSPETRKSIHAREVF